MHFLISWTIVNSNCYTKTRNLNACLHHIHPKIKVWSASPPWCCGQTQVWAPNRPLQILDGQCRHIHHADLTSHHQIFTCWAILGVRGKKKERGWWSQWGHHHAKGGTAKHHMQVAADRQQLLPGRNTCPLSMMEDNCSWWFSEKMQSLNFFLAYRLPVLRISMTVSDFNWDKLCAKSWFISIKIWICYMVNTTSKCIRFVCYSVKQPSIRSLLTAFPHFPDKANVWKLMNQPTALQKLPMSWCAIHIIL